jgi:hypothetical protein
MKILRGLNSSRATIIEKFHDDGNRESLQIIILLLQTDTSGYRIYPTNGREFTAKLSKYQFIERTVPNVSQSVARSWAARTFCLRVHVTFTAGYLFVLHCVLL